MGHVTHTTYLGSISRGITCTRPCTPVLGLEAKIVYCSGKWKVYPELERNPTYQKEIWSIHLPERGGL